MALKAIVESLDSLPEGIREHYTEQDGKFVLGVEAVNGYALEDVSGLKSAFSKEMEARKTLEKVASKWKDLDPDKAREALAKWDEFSTIDPKKEADKIAQAKVDAIVKQLNEKHAAEIGAAEDVKKRYYAQLESVMRDSAIKDAIAEAKGNPKVLLPHIRAATRMKETENGFAVEVIGQDGTPRISPASGSTAPMTIKELVAEFRQDPDFGMNFEASGNSGSGAQHGNGGGAPNVGKNLTGGAAVVAKMFPNLPAS